MEGEDTDEATTRAAATQEQLAVARRVHRRLTQDTPASALPHVLRRLLPRLLQHVDRIQQESVYASSSSDVLSMVQQQYTASIVYGREQLQQQSLATADNEDDAALLLQQQLAEEILHAIAHVWYSPVTMTLGLSLLLPTAPMSLLLHTWNTIETKLLEQQPQPITTPNDATANPTLHSVWLRLSWMVLDALLLHNGDDDTQDVDDNANEALFQLTLDVVLFPHCCSRVGHARLQQYPGTQVRAWKALLVRSTSKPWYGTERGRLLSILSSGTTTECSVPLATALLTLVIGEGSDVAIAASGSVVDDILGGSTSRRQHYAWCRPQLPAPQSILDFLLATFRPTDATTPGYYELLDMILEASTLGALSSWFSLAERVLRALPSDHGATVRVRWKEQFHRKVCNKALALLHVVVDNDDGAGTTPPEEKRPRRRQYPVHRENTVQLYQATRRQQLTMPDRCAAYDLWTAILDVGLAEPSTVQDQLLPIFLRCVVYECDTVLQPHALRTIERCCQHMSPTTNTPLLSARLVSVVCAPSVIVRTAAATTWIEALTHDTEAARHLWQHLYTNDPSPPVRAAATQALAQHNATEAQQQQQYPPESGPVYLDRNDELDMHVLQGEWQRTIESTAARFELPKDVCVLLLVAARYDATSVATALEHDRATTLHEYGIVVESEVQHPLVASCGICFDETVSYSACPQEHGFCRRCWHEYFNVTCQDALQQGINLTCPVPDCQVCVSPILMRSIDPEFAVRWETSVFEKFLAANESLSACRKENCSGVAMLLSGDPARCVTCFVCQTAYCFQCGSERHHPASCGAYRKWTQQIVNDSSFWVRMNSKPCPRCSVPIEKNTGCNHMICTQCSAHFCWLCLAELPTHLAPHDCNSVVAGTTEEQRAQFYTTRFHAHLDARLFESNRNGKFEQLFFLDQHDRDVIDEACQVLWRARTYLANACVAAWEMSQDESTIRNEDGILRLEVVPGSRLESFMNAQSTLVLLTEQLSSRTESKISLEKAYRTGGESDVKFALLSLSFVADTVSKYAVRLSNLCRNEQRRAQVLDLHHNEE